MTMKNARIKKLAIAGLLCAVAVVGSLISFPVLGSKCAPVQHMVNIFCAVLLGPAYGVGVAFVASLLRVFLSLGTVMAFPGSMLGALLCGIAYKTSKKIWLTLIAEVAGTSILGGLCAYPVAVYIVGQSAAGVAFYSYIFPFFISTAAGAILSALIIYPLSKTGVLKKISS